MVVSLRRTYRQTGTQHSRASTLASDQLDTMAEKGATAADIAQRKQRLLHGPEEFRDARSDQHYAKPFARIPAERRLADAVEGLAAYREREAAAHANLQRLREERVAREQEIAPPAKIQPGRKKRVMAP